MSIFLSEFLGSGILIALGNGVVANVVLNKTKGHNDTHTRKNNVLWIMLKF